jgi:tetratricopeptide (TPR) repeat protein
LYLQTGRLDEFIAKLEEQRVKNPENREAVERLVRIYKEQKRLPEASRVLDATRTAVSGDADLLYYVSHLYQSIDENKTAEEILQEVVRLDPAHAGAANDLGYTWADAGKNLKEAESLVRNAIQEEPDNESFLDSLGWVLYKRGKFAEARKFLDQSLHDAIHPDPVVLDHLGDVLYRLNQRTQAAKLWQQAAERMAEMASTREDLQKLKLQLIQKLEQVKGSGPVNVAPIAESTGTAVQASTPALP